MCRGITYHWRLFPMWKLSSIVTWDSPPSTTNGKAGTRLSDGHGRPHHSRHSDGKLKKHRFGFSFLHPILPGPTPPDFTSLKPSAAQFFGSHLLTWHANLWTLFILRTSIQTSGKVFVSCGYTIHATVEACRVCLHWCMQMFTESLLAVFWA